MAAQDRATLKTYFLGTPTYSVPTEANYSDLIDSFLNLTDDGAASGYGLWRLDASSNMYYNLATTKYWGIGTVTPTCKLHLVETADVPFVNIGNNTVSGGRAVAIGDGNSASGDYSFALGKDNDIDSSYSVSLGNNNIISSGLYNNVIGYDNSIYSSAASCVIGDTNTIGTAGVANSNLNWILGSTNTLGDSSVLNVCIGSSNNYADGITAAICIGQTNTISAGHDHSLTVGLSATSKGYWMAYFRYDKIYFEAVSGNYNFANIPTASAGLASGDVWSDGGTLKIIP